MNYSIMANTYGYVPDQLKRFLYSGTEERFTVVEQGSGQTVFAGELVPVVCCDLTMSDLKAGDFTGLKDDGSYLIRVGNSESGPFIISANAMYQLAWNGVNYLQQVRAGDSVTGFRAWTHNISHLDDGLLGERVAEELGLSGRWFDLVGGWYDATDVRYWASSWMALEFVQQLAEKVDPFWRKDMLLDELKWGNQLFLKTILPSGDVLGPLKADNYWTDNIIGNEDDRIVSKNIHRGALLFQLAYYELSLARVFRDIDPAYAELMANAGHRIMARLSRETKPETDIVGHGFRVLAYIEMHRSKNDPDWLEKARQEGRSILALQEKDYVGEQTVTKGFFYNSSAQTKTTDIRAHEACFLFALMELAEIDGEGSDWAKALRSYCRDYLFALSRFNPYHLTPARVFVRGTEGRRLGDSEISYRYFRPEGDSGNATGINPSLLSNAALLLDVGRLASDSDLTNLGWEQLNYILGMNSFNTSTVEGAGNVIYKYNGGQGVTNTFPRVSGAVLNGMAAEEDDEPLMDNGWEAAEYWLPQFGMLGRFLGACGTSGKVNAAGDLGILPKTAVLKTGRSQRFYTSDKNRSSKGIVWSVNGVPGGNDVVGIITDEGLYTAPGHALDNSVDVSASDIAGKELGISQIRIIDEPGTPVITELVREGTSVAIRWEGAIRADSYNIEVKDPVDGFYRITLNTRETFATLPYDKLKSKNLRVITVSHTLGYGTPSKEYIVD